MERSVLTRLNTLPKWLLHRNDFKTRLQSDDIHIWLLWCVFVMCPYAEALLQFHDDNGN